MYKRRNERANERENWSHKKKKVTVEALANEYKELPDVCFAILNDILSLPISLTSGLIFSVMIDPLTVKPVSSALTGNSLIFLVSY